MKTIPLPYSTLMLLLRSATDCLTAREIQKMDLESIKDSIRTAAMNSIEMQSLMEIQSTYDNKTTLSQFCIAAMPPSAIQTCKELLEEERNLEVKYAQYNERVCDGRLEQAIQTQMKMIELYKEFRNKLASINSQMEEYEDPRSYDYNDFYSLYSLDLAKRELLEKWKADAWPWNTDAFLEPVVPRNLLDLEYYNITKQAQLATAIESNYTADQLTLLIFAKGWEAFKLAQFSDDADSRRPDAWAIIQRDFLGLEEPNVQAILEEQKGIKELVELELSNRYLAAKMNVQEERVKLIVIEDAVLQEAKEELLRRVDAAEMKDLEQQQMRNLDISDLFTEST